MKKFVLFSLFLSFFPLLTSCSAKQGELIPGENMPAMAELLDYYNANGDEAYTKKLQEVRAVIDQASLEELYGIFDDALLAWENEQDIMGIESLDVRYGTDELSLIYPKNEKPYNNISAVVEIRHEDIPDTDSLRSKQNKMAEQIVSALRESPYGAYKLGDIRLNFQDASGDAMSKQKISQHFPLNGDVFIRKQDPEELYVQTTAYDYFDALDAEIFDAGVYGEYGNIFLEKFGILPESEQLLIEVDVDSPPVSMETDEFSSLLKERCRALCEQIADDPAAVNYLEDNGVRQIKILGNLRWDMEASEAGDHTFVYDLETAP